MSEVANWIPGKRHIFILAGTDVHPFKRMCEWADRWAAAHPDDDVLVQHGYTSPPVAARGVQILTPDALEEALSEADVAVSHGGPGTISTVRASGLRPVVLARNPAHGEHVDGHQMRFAAWAGERGLAIVVADEQGLDAAVEMALEVGRGSAAPGAQVETSLRALGDRIAEVLQVGPGRRRVPMVHSRRTRTN